MEGLRDGDAYTYDATHQTLFVLPASQAAGEQGNVQAAHVHQVRVRFGPPMSGKQPNDFCGDFATPISAVTVVLLAVAAYSILQHI